MKKVILALLFCLIAPFSHAEITDAEAGAMASTLATFFEHIRANQYDDAFALQTQETRDYFGSAAQFVAATQECCNALYDASEARAIGAIETAAGVDVYVLIVDKHLMLYKAVFAMKKHGTWQIDECHITLINVGGTEI